MLASIKFPKNFQPVGVSYKAIFVAFATLQRHEIKVTSQQDCGQSHARIEMSGYQCNHGSHLTFLRGRQNSTYGGKSEKKTGTRGSSIWIQRKVEKREKKGLVQITL